MRTIVLYRIRDKTSDAVIYTCKEDYANQMQKKGYIINAELKHILG